MTMPKSCYFLVFAFFLFIRSSLSQEFSYKFYGVPDGLAQSQVVNLYQDTKKFLWVATKGGVSRFDGTRFINFSRSDGYFEHSFQRIAETKNGDVWFQDEGGLTCWNGTKMVRFPTPLFNNPRILRLFYRSKNDELTIFDVQQKAKVRIVTFQNGKYTEKNFLCKGLDLAPFPIFQTEIGYDSTADRIIILSENQGLFSLKNSHLDTLSVNTGNTSSLSSGNDGMFYIWTGNEFNRINEHGLELVFKSEKPENVWLTNAVIDRNGVVFYQDHVGKITINDHGNIYHDSFGFSLISTMLLDRDNNLWIGTESGLYRLLSRAFVNYIPEKDDINPSIWSIVEDNRGSLYFASFTYGLQRFENDSFFQVKGFEKFSKFKGSNFYMGSIRDHQGNILLTKSDIGGIKYNGSEFSRIFKDGAAICSFQFFEDPDNGDLLAGTSKGLIIKTQKGIETLFEIKPGRSVVPYITSIQKDKMGRYWLGGFHGISLYDKGIVTPLPTRSMPFSEGGNALLKDSRGNIWIGNDKGLFLYDYNTFRKIGHPDLKTFITALALVSDTGLLIGSVNGLDWLDLKAFYAGKVQWKHFDKSNGFQGMEVGQNGFFRDSKGYYWIPTSDRVVRFDPRQITAKKTVPQTYISAVSILSERMTWDQLADTNIWAGSLSLRHFQKNIRFSFIGINMSDPEKVLYKFRLEGYDRGWSEPDRAMNAVYTNLPPGNYSFYVKSCNEDGLWSQEQVSLDFRIVPAFYQTWWFWILCFLVGSATFTYLGFLFTTRKRKIIQEKLEQDKKMAELQLISLKNQIDPHFTFNALNAIASVVLKEDKELAYRFFMKLSALIRAILVSGDKLTRTLGEELTFVSNYLEVEKFRFRERFEYTLDFDPQLNLDAEVPKMVVQTYVENAIKHGLMHKDAPGHLWVKVVSEPTGIRIEVRDDGVGRIRAKDFAHNSTGKGLVILKGYYEYFRNYRKTDIQNQIIDLFDEQSKPIGTKVEIFIPVNPPVNEQK
jgi:ligand-binding sensor domain-containing protein/two-component sensor histidine kinase